MDALGHRDKAFIFPSRLWICFSRLTAFSVKFFSALIKSSFNEFFAIKLPTRDEITTISMTKNGLKVTWQSGL